jgi:hypothetical protein
MRLTIGCVLSAVTVVGALLDERPAAAQGNTTTTSSTETHRTINVLRMYFRYDTYQTRITAHLNGNPNLLYDQTFPVAFSDPAVQAAIAAATSALQGAGATAVQGPTMLSSQTTFVGTTVTFQDVITGSTTTVATNTYTGPLCIGVGNRDIGPSVPCPPAACGALPPASPSPCFGTPFPIAPGDVNVDTLTHTEIFVNRMTTERDTFLTQAHYDLAGDQSAEHVPALADGGLITLAGLLVATALIALRARA